MADNTSPASSRTDVPLEDEKNKLAGRRSFTHSEGYDAAADVRFNKGGELYVVKHTPSASHPACSLIVSRCLHCYSQHRRARAPGVPDDDRAAAHPKLGTLHPRRLVKEVAEYVLLSLLGARLA